VVVVMVMMVVMIRGASAPALVLTLR